MRNDEAIKSISEAVDPYRRNAIEQLNGWGQHFGDVPVVGDDDIKVIRTIVRALSDLSRWRAWVVRRRTDRLFGTRLVRVVEAADDHSDDADRHRMRSLVERDADGELVSVAEVDLQEQRGRPTSSNLDWFLKEIERLQSCWIP